MSRRLPRAALAATAALVSLGTGTGVAAGNPASCDVGKYYKICAWSGPDFTGELRSLAFNEDEREIGPDFVVRSYKNWHAGDYFIDVDAAGAEHRYPLAENAQDPNVRGGAGIPVDVMGGGNSR